MNERDYVHKNDFNSCLHDCAVEARELYLGEYVPYNDGPPTSLGFYRDWVSKNCPCIFRNANKHWFALRKWNNDYFKKTIGDKVVTVAVTPNGYADAIKDGYFVLPEERRMCMHNFLEILENKKCSDGVCYIQRQNSNLTTEFKELLSDVDEHIPWASQAFNKMPDAVNFWMGQGRAVTSLHKDHYENLYCVVKGQKTFTLYPPSDRPFIPYKNYPVGQYIFTSGEWSIECPKNTVVPTIPWIATDPLNLELAKYPQFAKAKPIICTVNAGEILYLPSLWFHHVQQTDSTIAVNYWYDMEFDIKYNYYQTLDKLTNVIYNQWGPTKNIAVSPES